MFTHIAFTSHISESLQLHTAHASSKDQPLAGFPKINYSIHIRNMPFSFLQVYKIQRTLYRPGACNMGVNLGRLNRSMPQKLLDITDIRIHPTNYTSFGACKFQRRCSWSDGYIGFELS